METTNRLQAAIDAASEKQQAGADLAVITAAARQVLAGAGEFGKSLDRSARRVVLQVTGTRLEPGAANGRRRADGSVSYRAQ